MPSCNQLYLNWKIVFFVILLWGLIPALVHAQEVQENEIQALIVPIDSTRTILPDSTLTTPVDSTLISLADTIQPKKDKIDAEIRYSAQDSIVFLGNGTGFLFGQGEVTQNDINLKADYIRVKMDSSIVYARGVPDSLGVIVGDPVFMEGQTQYSSKEMTYNLKTRKAFIRQGVTQQGEGYVLSERTKKDENDILYLEKGKYTTCDDHDCPHFYLSLSKGKMKTGKYVVSGPAHLVIAGVPLPLVIPFGFYPFTDTYSSGILMPSYTDDLTRGFGLLNGGYYFAINDYVDLELRSEIYTKGTWALNGTSTYVKRYKFRGSFGVNYREDVTGEKDMPDYSKAKNLSINWNHSQDAKANPYSTLSASVNFTTSGYNRSNIQNYHRPDLNAANTTSSSVSYSKRFPKIPALNIATNVMVSQRTKDSTISLTLPNLTVGYSSTKPFKRKSPIGNERWYEKITMSYSGSFSNSIQTKEDKLLTSSFARDWQNNVRHAIPISATFNLFNNINITPSINYEERWNFRSYQKSWDVANQRELIDTINGFNRAYQFNTNISASTKLYGFFTPLIGKKYVQQIRHVMTPTIGFSYNPDFGEPMWNNYYSYIEQRPNVDNPSIYDEREVFYSRYGESFPSRGESRSITYSLANNIEMKVPNLNDTIGNEATKKISLIDQLSISGNYNFAADSMNWSNIAVNLRIKVGKKTISLSGAFDPYMYALDSRGNPVRVNELRWNHGKFPKFLGSSQSFSHTINNDTFNKLLGKKDKSTTNENKNNETIDGMTGETDIYSKGVEDLNAFNTPQAETEVDGDGYEKVKIPWSININYNVTYARADFNKDKMEHNMKFTHNFGMSGNISLGNNWSANGNMSYDFQAKKISQLNLGVRRNLHCWSMSANFVPIGIYKTYNFHIGVNASMLQDLKYEKHNRPQAEKINWY